MFKKLSKLVLSLALSLPLILGAITPALAADLFLNPNIGETLTDILVVQYWSPDPYHDSQFTIFDNITENSIATSARADWQQLPISLLAIGFTSPTIAGDYSLYQFSAYVDGCDHPTTKSACIAGIAEHGWGSGDNFSLLAPTPPTPSGLPAGLWTGGLTYSGAMAQIASPTAGIAGDMLPVAVIVIGISLGLYLLTYVIGQFRKPKDEFDNPKK
jgi:hypothetical protein